MPFRLQTRHFIIALGVTLVLAIGLVGQYQRWFELGWFHFGQTFSQPHALALGLADYRAVIQGKPIEGLVDDVSALTFDPQRRSLYTVTNQNSELVELSLEGDVLRRITLRGFGDPEAVEYISPGVLVISDEYNQRLLRVQVDEQTTLLDAADAEQLVLNMGRKGNRGFEGLAYDAVGQRLFVAKEEAPMLIYEVRGFPRNDDAATGIEITRNPQRDQRLFVRDLSSLQFDPRSGHLLALSDQSRLLVELDADNQPVGTLSLRRGAHGLTRTIPQAEGVALDDAGTLYLVSEPNLFYVFKKTAEPQLP
jgi:uncharacterized protein YjiK